MRFIDDIKRENAEVVINIHSNLGTCRPVYPFSFGCGDDQELAELLKRHLTEELEKYQAYIASHPLYFLEPKEITRLKSFLNKNWDGRNNCHK